MSSIVSLLHSKCSEQLRTVLKATMSYLPANDSRTSAVTDGGVGIKEETIERALTLREKMVLRPSEVQFATNPGQ